MAIRDTITKLCIFALGMCLVFSIILLCVRAARAEQADCGLIRDHDMQKQCYAIRDRQPASCNLIQDDDVRRLCRAQSERK